MFILTSTAYEWMNAIWSLIARCVGACNQHANRTEALPTDTMLVWLFIWHAICWPTWKFQWRNVVNAILSVECSIIEMFRRVGWWFIHQAWTLWIVMLKIWPPLSLMANGNKWLNVAVTTNTNNIPKSRSMRWESNIKYGYLLTHWLELTHPRKHVNITLIWLMIIWTYHAKSIWNDEWMTENCGRYWQFSCCFYLKACQFQIK